ncbi:MAG: single-stranded DNA-binding protein [Bacteroidota bacterium]
MNSIKNSVQLIGHLGKDPEVKVLENGKMLANINIATNDIYKNSRGEKVIETQWHRAIAWGKTAELMQRLLKKGNEVAIQGKLTHRSYEDKTGITRYYSQVVITEFVKIGKSEVV